MERSLEQKSGFSESGLFPAYAAHYDHRTLALLMSMALWGSIWWRKMLRGRCDDAAIVTVLNSSSSK